MQIITDRLILRLWRKEDAAAFAAINQDAKVIEFLRGPLSLEDCQDFISHANAHFAKHGFGLWAATLRETGEVIGFVGLNVPDFESHFTPCVEIGWRLASQHWGKGYATEAAKAALEIGFKNFDLKEIVAFTVPQNLRSIAVMEKLKMKRDLAGDFAHPKLALDHPLSQHILYRISK
ncbi:MAG: GNAT family N-acetyltransferase [Rickettsiales bacterium]|nr:GNAT family N-acetyltransferase [Rickettsiales bacterium]